MPAVTPSPRVKLRASTRRVPRAHHANTATNAALDAEPNMRLSRAVLVMLLLHVVAVGGIIAFSLSKDRSHNHAGVNTTPNAVEAEDSDLTPTRVEGRDADRPVADGAGTLSTTRTGQTLTRVANEPTTATRPSATPGTANDTAARIASGGRSTPANSPTPAEKNSRAPQASGKTYVVKKGDSAHTIAEHLKVDSSALLKLNGIDDPKKLKPGQTLKVPAPSKGK